MDRAVSANHCQTHASIERSGSHYAATLPSSDSQCAHQVSAVSAGAVSSSRGAIPADAASSSARTSCPLAALCSSNSLLRCSRCWALFSLSAAFASSVRSIPRPSAPLTSRLAAATSTGVRADDEGGRVSRASSADGENGGRDGDDATGLPPTSGREGREAGVEGGGVRGRGLEAAGAGTRRSRCRSSARLSAAVVGASEGGAGGVAVGGATPGGGRPLRTGDRPARLSVVEASTAREETARAGDSVERGSCAFARSFCAATPTSIAQRHSGECEVTSSPALQSPFRLASGEEHGNGWVWCSRADTRGVAV